MSNDPLVILPNMEGLLVEFLQAQAELDAYWIGTVFGDRTDYPALRVTQLFDRKMTSEPLWGSAFEMQIESYGGSKVQAHTGAATAEGVIAARIRGEHSRAVISGVDIGGMIDLPDDEYEPARPRWITTCTIYARPLATITS